MPGFGDPGCCLSSVVFIFYEISVSSLMFPLPDSCLWCAAEEKIIQCNLMSNLALWNGMYQRHLINLRFLATSGGMDVHDGGT